MSNSEESGDKPYEPSPKKLEDARKKGEVPRSNDLLTAAAYSGLLLAGLVFGAGLANRIGTAFQIILERPDELSRQFLSDGENSLAGGLLHTVLLGVSPAFAIPALLTILVAVAQKSFTVTPSKLLPKLNRISPLSNVKNKFGRNGLFEFSKSFLKLLTISAVLGLFLSNRMEEMIGFVRLDAQLVTVGMMQLSLDFLLVALVITLIIGSLDFFWQHAEHLRKNRMSHKEMTDEQKQTEGDPHLKQSRRQKGYDIATNRMMADVPTADVIIVNPKHYAVALKWDRSRAGAPIIVAKGVDEIAARIREIAHINAIPVHRDPPTARAIHGTARIGSEIDQAHYAAVAAAIRFADKMRRK